MKATLKHVDNQYILIVDERPKEFKDYWIYIGFDEPLIINTPLDLPNWFGKLWDKENYFKIIAAENLDGLKKLKLTLNQHWMIEDIIDTEVEVTEEEDYYLIRF